MKIYAVKNDKQYTIDSTKKHMEQVSNNIKDFIEKIKNNLNNKENKKQKILIEKLNYRANNHDKSKLEEKEFPYFAEFTPKLENCTYGSDEYKEFLKGLKPALDHHYSVNSHHPEFHKNGINDMSIVDIIEMYCDWCAAVKRHKDGNILKSININKNRFKISDQLTKILENSTNNTKNTKNENNNNLVKELNLVDLINLYINEKLIKNLDSDLDKQIIAILNN